MKSGYGASARVFLCWIACAVLSGAARAQSADSTSTYPVSARLTVSVPRDACLIRGDESCEATAKALHEAYENAFRRMFQSPGAQPADLEIALSPVSGDVIQTVGGREVVLRARAVISAAPGELDRLTCSGRSAVLDSGRESIMNAAQRASAEVARDFERLFADSNGVFTWLRTRGVEPADSAFSWPLRADNVGFADVGAGPMIGGGDGTAPGFLARFGVTGRSFVVQGVAGRWVPSFKGTIVRFNNGIQYDTDLSTTDVGIEAGPRIGLGNAFELRLGGGIHLLWGTADLHDLGSGESTSFSSVTPTVFGALHYTAWPTGSRFRIRGGLEMRAYMFPTADFPEFGRSVSIASTYVGVYVGVETPFGSKSSLREPKKN